jgi:CrcB protein
VAEQRSQHALGTLAANLIGGYLIGVFIALFQAMPQLDPAWKLADHRLSGCSDHVFQLLGRGHRPAAAAAPDCRSGLGSVHLVGSLFMTYMGMLSWSIGFSR